MLWFVLFDESLAVHVAFLVPVIDVSIPVIVMFGLESKSSMAVHVPVIASPVNTFEAESENKVMLGAVLSGETFMAAEPLTVVPLNAVIVALPKAIEVTRPVVEFTVAIAELLEVYVMVAAIGDPN